MRSLTVREEGEGRGGVAEFEVALAMGDWQLMAGELEIDGGWMFGLALISPGAVVACAGMKGVLLAGEEAGDEAESILGELSSSKGATAAAVANEKPAPAETGGTDCDR